MGAHETNDAKVDDFMRSPAILIGGPLHGTIVNRRAWFFVEIIRQGWDGKDPATAVLCRYDTTYDERDGVMAFVYTGWRSGDGKQRGDGGAAKARSWLRRWKRAGTFPRTAPPTRRVEVQSEPGRIEAEATARVDFAAPTATGAATRERGR